MQRNKFLRISKLLNFSLKFNFSIKFRPQIDTCYYKILNLNSSATLEDIKKEYYKLAKKYHPDNYNEHSQVNQTVYK
jgi:preprotein translocase subunit Sec63